MIRAAKQSDIPMIVALWEDFHAEANPPYSFDKPSAYAFVGGMIESKDAIVLVSSRGVICGFVTPNPVNFEWKMAMELYWWAEDGKGGELMKAFKKQARDMGADEIRISCRASTPKVGNHLERTGFALDEQVYTRIN